MTISFVPNTNIKEVKVKGYGTVKIRPYGAGEELQIQKSLRELNELQEKAKALLAEAKDKYDNDDSKLPDSFKKEFEQIQKKVNLLSTELNDLIRGIITSDEKGVAERLYNELPLTEVRRLVSFALGRDGDAEA